MTSLFLALQSVDLRPLPQVNADNGTISTGLSIMYVTIGAVALLLIVIAALRYIVAAGDTNKIAESKRMIAYTLVGAVVVGLAATIVQFVFNHT